MSRPPERGMGLTQRHLHVVGNMPEWVESNPEWKAALYLLDSPLLQGKNTRRWVNFEWREIDFPSLMEASKPWSSSERLLVMAAFDLFGGGAQTGLKEILTVLDEENIQRVLKAMQMFF
jgi:hypothetical protein